MNEYGLNADYLTMNFRVLLRDIERYTPDEMHRALLRLAETIKPVVPDGYELAIDVQGVVVFDKRKQAGVFVNTNDHLYPFFLAMLKGAK